LTATSGPDPVLGALPDVLAPAVRFYLDLHRSPELSGAEERTAAAFAARLESYGYQVAHGVGGHGVVGVLRAGPGPLVLLRAELDALPLKEDTGAAYASRESAPDPASGGAPVPVAHACGHDMHLACLAGTADLLARGRRWWRGTVLVVGQPAEETLTGAEAMLRDGLYERFGVPDVALAQHTAPLPAGMVAHGGGLMLSAGALLDVEVHGRGGHAATAHLTVNPVAVAAAAVLAIESAVADAFGPDDHVVATVGALHAGTRGNIVPRSATLRVSVRAPDPAGVERAVAVVRRAVAGVCAARGCPGEPQVRTLAVSPPTVCDQATLAVLRRAHSAALGAGRLTGWPPSSATEDFGLFGPAGRHLHGGADVRLGYWMLGSVGRRQWAAAPGATGAQKLAALPANHSPGFLPDPRATTTAGITALTAAALSQLATAHR
jgi:hippurate hydrolase